MDKRRRDAVRETGIDGATSYWRQKLSESCKRRKKKTDEKTRETERKKKKKNDRRLKISPEVCIIMNERRRRVENDMVNMSLINAVVFHNAIIRLGDAIR